MAKLYVCDMCKKSVAEEVLQFLELRTLKNGRSVVLRTQVDGETCDLSIEICDDCLSEFGEPPRINVKDEVQPQKAIEDYFRDFIEMVVEDTVG